MFRSSNGKSGSGSKASNGSTGTKEAASESTPLTEAAAAAAGKAAVDQVSDLAGKVMTQENLEQISKVAAERVDEISKKLMDGTLSIRAMALVGGIALSFFAATGILGDILSLNFSGALMEVYTLVFGLLMIVLESNFIKIPDTAMQKVYKYVLFLKFIWGRGILYFIAGNLQFAQGGIFNWCVGGFVMMTGVLYVVAGRQAAKKLSDMKHNIFSEKMLKKKFEEADTEGNGTINLEQFGGLCDGLDLDLTKREKEAIFFHLDTSDDDLLTYQEFSHWWDNYDAAVASV